MDGCKSFSFSFFAVDATQNSSTTSHPFIYPILVSVVVIAVWCQCVRLGDVSARLPIYLAHPLFTLVLNIPPPGPIYAICDR